MSCHSTIILAILAMALGLIISFEEEVRKAGPRKSNKCEPFCRMVGLTDERKEKWASESKSGFVCLEHSGIKMVWESIERPLLEQDEHPQGAHAKPLLYEIQRG